jgi:hypothetical protein
MANTTVNLNIETVGGPGPFIFSMPVDGGTHIYEGVLVSQLTGTGMVVPYSTASTSRCIGVAQHEQDNTDGADGAKRVFVESRRMFAMTNGAGGDAFSDANLIGSLVYGTDDHTVADNSSSGTRKPVGFFYGFEADGLVRVYIDPALAAVVEALQLIADAPASADALRESIVAAFG